MVPVWLLRKVKRSLDVCALCRNLNCLDSWGLLQVWLIQKTMSFFFLVQVSLLVAAFKLLAFPFCLGFSKLVLFLPVLGSWFDSSSWFFEIFHWDFHFWQKYSESTVVNSGNSFEKVSRLGDGYWEAAWVDSGTISAYILELEIKIMETLQRFLVYMFVYLVLSGCSDAFISILDNLGWNCYLLLHCLEYMLSVMFLLRGKKKPLTLDSFALLTSSLLSSFLSPPLPALSFPSPF